MVILQERDMKILRLGREHQFFTLDQVLPLFNAGGVKRASKRVSELRGAGYVTRDEFLTLGRKPVYRLTRLGNQVAANGSIHLPTRKLLHAGTLVHDHVVGAVRILIEKAWSGGHYVPEQSLKSMGHSLIPDGIYYFANKRGVAIEVENTEKWSRRFLRIHERWEEEEHDDIIIVLFVATSERLFRRLKELIPRINSEQPFALISWEAWQKGDDRCLLLNAEKQITVPLAEIQQRLEQSLPSAPEPAAS